MSKIRKKVCTKCGEDKEATQVNFHINNASSDRLRNDCKPCHIAKVTDCQTRQSPELKRKFARNSAKASLRKEIQDMKIARGCTDCGYKKSHFALDFDHMPGTEKRLGIAEFMRRISNAEEIRAEVAKCEVVCANCHRIRTAARRVILP